MAQHFDTPPMLTGEDSDKLGQIYSYLIQMSDKLNDAMSALSVEDFVAEDRTALQAVVDGSEAQVQNETLKSLIIKTANVVRTEMTMITAELETDITAVSEDFGELKERYTNDLQIDSDGVSQRFTQLESITTDDNETLNVYRSYLNCGTFTVDGDTRTGVEIGTGMGTEEEERLATFDGEELVFWHQGSRICWMSGNDNLLHIASAEIEHDLRIGKFLWTIRSSDGNLVLYFDRQGE